MLKESVRCLKCCFFVLFVSEKGRLMTRFTRRLSVTAGAWSRRYATDSRGWISSGSSHAMSSRKSQSTTKNWECPQQVTNTLILCLASIIGFSKIHTVNEAIGISHGKRSRCSLRIPSSVQWTTEVFNYAYGIKMEGFLLSFEFSSWLFAI